MPATEETPESAVDIFGIDSLGEEEKRELVRKNLLNLTTSYSDEADVFTEIIQNAVDAIERAVAIAGEGVGELTVVVGRRSENAHYIYVQDSGNGMPEDIVDKVFIPGFSHEKRQGQSIGYKGVGMLSAPPEY